MPERRKVTSLGLRFSEECLGVKILQKVNLEEKLNYFHNLLHSLIKLYIMQSCPRIVTFWKCCREIFNQCFL